MLRWTILIYFKHLHCRHDQTAFITKSLYALEQCWPVRAIMQGLGLLWKDWSSMNSTALTKVVSSKLKELHLVLIILLSWLLRSIEFQLFQAKNVPKNALKQFFQTSRWSLIFRLLNFKSIPTRWRFLRQLTSAFIASSKASSPWPEVRIKWLFRSFTDSAFLVFTNSRPDIYR